MIQWPKWTPNAGTDTTQARSWGHLGGNRPRLDGPARSTMSLWITSVKQRLGQGPERPAEVHAPMPCDLG